MTKSAKLVERERQCLAPEGRLTSQALKGTVAGLCCSWITGASSREGFAIYVEMCCSSNVWSIRNNRRAVSSVND